MEYTHFTEELDIDIGQLDVKKQQTDYKIKYIKEYMTRWLQENAHRRDITDLNFVDCMCNAGIYQDGDLCTSMEVLLLFAKAADVHKDKQFNLFFNDKDRNKTEICSKIAKALLCDKQRSNINIFINTLDVNDYLSGLHFFRKYFQKGGASVVFVGPEDFGTVIISRLTKFIARYKCDVIFNAFISDYARDGIDKHIRICIGNAAVINKDELIAYIASKLKTGKMQYVFSYRFAVPQDTELYQVIFATPHIKGVEALKEALWHTFNVNFYHRDFKTDPKQLSLFAEDDDRQVLISTHARVAKALLQDNFAGQTVDYEQIELFLTEHTMLSKADFIRIVLIPLIKKRLVIKQGLAENESTYKDDEYTFV